MAKNGKFAKGVANVRKELARNGFLYLMLLLPIAYYIIFCYAPMYGVQIAFRNYSVRKGILASPWVGFKYFKSFFDNALFGTIIINTLRVSIYVLIAGFFPPIILALTTNELRSPKLQQCVKLVTYAPNFMSVVIVVGIFQIIFKEPTGIMTNGGPINQIIQAFGGEPIEFMLEPEWFPHMYVWSHIWQYMGFASIIYMATLSGIDPALYEAATVDGAGRFQRMWHISLPQLLSTAAIIFIMDTGKILSVGFERVYLLQNGLNRSTSEVISTYVYSVGLGQGKFSYGAAVDLFNGVVNLIMICTMNYISRKVSSYSLW